MVSKTIEYDSAVRFGKEFLKESKIKGVLRAREKIEIKRLTSGDPAVFSIGKHNLDRLVVESQDDSKFSLTYSRFLVRDPLEALISYSRLYYDIFGTAKVHKGWSMSYETFSHPVSEIGFSLNVPISQDRIKDFAPEIYKINREVETNIANAKYGLFNTPFKMVLK